MAKNNKESSEQILSRDELKEIRELLGFSLRECDWFSDGSFPSNTLQSYESGKRGISENTARNLIDFYLYLAEVKLDKLRLKEKKSELQISDLKDIKKFYAMISKISKRLTRYLKNYIIDLRKIIKDTEETVSKSTDWLKKSKERLEESRRQS